MRMGATITNTIQKAVTNDVQSETSSCRYNFVNVHWPEGGHMGQPQKTGFKCAIAAAFRLRIKIASIILMLIILGAGSAFSATDEGRSAPDAPASAKMREGGKLFARKCVVCHQASGKGVPGVFPPLAGNPHLGDTKLVVRTIHGGKSGPIDINGKKFNSKMPPIGAAFSPEQVAAVATYVRNSWGNSFGAVADKEATALLQPGSGRNAEQLATSPQAAPPGATAALPMAYAPPDSRLLPASLKGLPRGGRLFRLYCAGCHGATAMGGAVPFAGMNAPSLKNVPAVAVSIFVRQGPGPMPAFPRAVLSDQDVAAVAKYVGFLHSKPHPGGFALGFLGPVVEGFVAMIGLLVIILCTVWIEKGERG